MPAPSEPSAGTPAGGHHYRPDIDGLRAVAVVAVILFHAFPRVAPGGFVGVDVFFVISGYLITGIILAGLAAGRFSFADFYARRIRRIFPALAVVLASTYAAGWFTLYADAFERLGHHIAAGAGFLANFALWNEAGYFDAAADTKPLLHLWSLGIEEQFYLAWPLLVFLSARSRVGPLGMTLAVAAASFAFSLYTVRIDLVGAFYSPLTRVWELLVGAALACAAGVPAVEARLRAIRSARGAANAASAAGVAAIVLAVAVLDTSRHFPGLWALLPAVGSGLLLAAGPAAWFNRVVLSHRAAVWVGLISYPLYLWHWPLLSMARLVHGDTPPVLARAGLVCASVLLAWATYRLVERPIRFGAWRPAAVPVLCSAIAALLAIGLVTSSSGGVIGRRINQTGEASFVQYYDRMRHTGIAGAYRAECDFMDWRTEQVRPSIDPACTAAGGGRTVFLWGDSYAQSLSLGLRSLLGDGPVLAQVATSGCRPGIGIADRDMPNRRCERANTYAIERIAALRPAIVVLAQKGRHLETDWRRLAGDLRGMGVETVVVVGPFPEWRPALPTVVASRYRERDYSRVSHGLVTEVFDVDRELQSRLADADGLRYASLASVLCDADGCIARAPGGGWDLMTFDAGHLTPRGSVYVAGAVLRPFLLR